MYLDHCKGWRHCQQVLSWHNADVPKENVGLSLGICIYPLQLVLTWLFRHQPKTNDDGEDDEKLMEVKVSECGLQLIRLHSCWNCKRYLSIKGGESLRFYRWSLASLLWIYFFIRFWTNHLAYKTVKQYLINQRGTTHMGSVTAPISSGASPKMFMGLLGFLGL